MNRNLEWIGLACVVLSTLGCDAGAEEASTGNLALTAQMPPCDLLDHRSDLLKLVKEKIADGLTQHFQGSAVAVRSIAYETLVYEIWEDAQSPYLTIKGTASLS